MKTRQTNNQDETMIFFGPGGLKATVNADGSVSFGHWLVSFGGADVSGEYFTKSCDFGRPMEIDVPQPMNLYYHHGMDAKVGKKSLGAGTVTLKEAGLWYDAQIAANDGYAKMVAKLVAGGKLGLSSGAAAHLVERKTTTKGVEIIRWPLAEASLTPTPAEPRNMIAPLKSLLTYSWRDGSGSTTAPDLMTVDADDWAETIFDGVGESLTRDVLQTLFYRLSGAASSALACGDTERAKVLMAAAIDEFADNGARMFAATVDALSAEDADEEAKSFKSFADGEAMKPITVRQFERFLREQGSYSRTEAAAIASKGFALLRDAGSAETDGLKRIQALCLETLTLENDLLAIGATI